MGTGRVLLRADGDSTMGFGHMSRTLALAAMLKDAFECSFFSWSTAFMEESHKYCSQRTLLKKETHFADFLSHITPEDVVVLDNYYFDTAYQGEVAKRARALVYIDDIPGPSYRSDMIINHGCGITLDHYQTHPSKGLLLGPDYALLRPEFCTMAPHARGERKKYDLLISMGGADPQRLTPKIVQAVQHIRPTMRIAALTPHTVNTCTTFYNLTAKDLKTLFHESRAAILPASTIAVEACACRIPCACGYFMENQKQHYRGLTNAHAVFPLKDLRDPLSCNTPLATFLHILAKPTRTTAMIHAQEKLVDGRSPERLRAAFRRLNESA
ncbi:PseG/SpsG family protein [Chitinivibrio alkaliphilus]|uniref:Pseudaminic acid biosynthesis-associated protein PseG n=1 Tax=Chitinivibrio alkaliphilus ACht1 TaxID=1313304 RepID=U7D4F7_9BACT|nr:pseudaminic acid biosynthesis-associated protein PseG [Chitinivibrio alkaliphilus]ERP30823.1 pseudaminic acid biosynthesis-associated protein PseG [Chitinivibrio alkaliphilus ACht1]